MVVAVSPKASFPSHHSITGIRCVRKKEKANFLSLVFQIFSPFSGSPFLSFFFFGNNERKSTSCSVPLISSLLPPVSSFPPITTFPSHRSNRKIMLTQSRRRSKRNAQIGERSFTLSALSGNKVHGGRDREQVAPYPTLSLSLSLSLLVVFAAFCFLATGTRTAKPLKRNVTAGGTFIQALPATMLLIGLLVFRSPAAHTYTHCTSPRSSPRSCEHDCMCLVPCASADQRRRRRVEVNMLAYRIGYMCGGHVSHTLRQQERGKQEYIFVPL